MFLVVEHLSAYQELFVAHTRSLFTGPTTAVSLMLFFYFCGSSSIRTSHKLPEIRSSVTAVKAEILSVLRAALSVPVSEVGMCFLKSTHQEE